jgi:hypothetical protein
MSIAELCIVIDDHEIYHFFLFAESGRCVCSDPFLGFDGI